MRLSKNLTLKEVIKSNTATRLGIDNSPTSEHVENLKLLAVNVFQKARDYFGKPLYISSGYRSNDLNNRIGGSKTSQHSKGQAIDIDNDNRNSVSNKEVFEYIRDNLNFDQLINENNYSWVHVSYKSKGNRNQVLDMNKGKYTIHNVK